MKISLIQPGRNNLVYLQWSYDSIRKNQGDHEVEICVADDASTDGTWDWCLEMMDKDPLFKAHRNEGPDRLGHTILYDTLINEVATKDIAMIYHADMYLCPGALDAIEREIKEKTIVSLTRIEPPLHPQGPEKIIWNGGVEPEEFKEKDLLELLPTLKEPSKITGGIFAPWAFYRKDFQEIGGHDPLYAPQSKEDSDIFNRFQLNGVEFKQVWDGFVYHMTCRGSRRNTKDKAENIFTDSPEWLEQNRKSTRNFIRKWGHFVAHDSLFVPIVYPKFDVVFKVKFGNDSILRSLEPWCNKIQIDCEIEDYIKEEQSNTIYDMKDRVFTQQQEVEGDIIIDIDGITLTQEDFQNIQNLSQILQSIQSPGSYKAGNIVIKVNKLEQYQNNLIHL